MTAEGEDREPLAFSVDTHIFRELGELLVGRDSTALAELIKNCYDADAQSVIVTGTSMDRPERGTVRIRDDGHGMTIETFKAGFLRVAGRQKEKGDRRSPKYHRRFTGEKGIGRLAAHKLAHRIEVVSVPDVEMFRDGRAFRAVIDWDAVEGAQTLDQLAKSSVSKDEQEAANAEESLDYKEPPQREAITFEFLSESELEKLALGKSGTAITLSNLRKRWTTAERVKLHGEVQDLQFPAPLNDISELLYPGERLLDPLKQQSFVRDTPSGDVFSIEFEGDLDTGDAFWEKVIDQKAYLVEIDATSKARPISVLITASAKAAKDGQKNFSAPRLTEAGVKPLQSERINLDWPKEECPTFLAKLLIRDGAASEVPSNAKAFVSRAAGVRVYVEGFRVLPYGEVGNDWLRLDYEYSQRTRRLDEESRAGLSMPASRQVLGAVVMTQESSKPLRMLVNREGFIPDTTFDTLVDTVKKGINLYVRFKASQSASLKKGNGVLVQIRPLPEVEEASNVAVVQRLVERHVAEANESARTAVDSLRKGDTARALAQVQEAARAVTSAVSTAGGMVPEAAFMRVLASVGLQIGTFVHEVRSVHANAVTLRHEVDRHRGEAQDLPRATRTFLTRMSKRLSDLTLALEKEASNLSDVLSADSRRRKSAQVLLVRVEQALRIVGASIERREIEVQIDVDPTLRTLPMYSSELVVIFSNLLTNAIKAAGQKGRINVRAKLKDDWLLMRVDNTGVSVDLADGERWFRPFESTSTQVDPTLGIGMGMGLPITRSLVESYGGEIAFILPTTGFSTAVEVRLPQKNV